jgi:hypothetical protein
MQQLKTEIGDLFKQRLVLKDQLAATCVVDEVSTERLKRRFRGILKSNVLSALQQAAVYHELACLVATQGRYTEALSYIRLSRELGLDSFALAFTSAYLALLNGYVIDARREVEGIMDTVVPSAIPLLRAHQAQVGMLGGFMADESLNSDFQNEALEAKKIIAKLSIDDWELTSRLDAACRMIRANINHPILSYKLFAREGDGILYRFMVKADVVRIAELNEMLLDMLLDTFDGDIDNELSILITPWSPVDRPISEGAYLVGVS